MCPHYPQPMALHFKKSQRLTSWTEILNWIVPIKVNLINPYLLFFAKLEFEAPEKLENLEIILITNYSLWTILHKNLPGQVGAKTEKFSEGRET